MNDDRKDTLSNIYLKLSGTDDCTKISGFLGDNHLRGGYGLLMNFSIDEENKDIERGDDVYLIRIFGSLKEDNVKGFISDIGTIGKVLKKTEKIETLY